MSDNHAQKGGITVRSLIGQQNRSPAGTISIPSDPFSEPELPDRTEISNSSKRTQVTSMPVSNNSEPDSEGVPFVPADFVAGLFSTSIRYENSKKTVLIDQGFKNMLDTLSQISKTDVSQILNNILNNFFGMESHYSIVPELHRYIQKQQYTITQNFKPNNKR